MKASSKRAGWDPLVIISQIVALQSCHYLLLALIAPPMLHLFADPTALSLEGGASNVAMIMDWREMVGRGTIDTSHSSAGMGEDYMRLPASLGRHKQPWRDAERHQEQQQQGQQDVGGRDLAQTLRDAANDTHLKGYHSADPRRGWVLSTAWIAASAMDVLYMYHLIRRPTHILDFSLTLVFNHIVLTTYYASSFPTSLFFWAVIAGSAAVQIIWAEQLCVRREMKEGFTLGQGWKTDERNEDGLPSYNQPQARRQRRNSAPSAVGGTYERIPMVEVG